ncbi:hypothetical protein F5X97DRAFT_325781 [Nemania serpens]|nr:hypothetical protein F5X97DRAFT_325781 [Nemania serpens]
MRSIFLASAFFLLGACQKVIERDIVILGGGATGIYAAVHLADYNQSVVVIEKRDRLGGNTHTYYDPVTRIPVNFGVQFYYDDAVVHAFFDRLGVPLTSGSAAGSLNPLFVDIARSSVAKNQKVPPIGDDYLAQLSKYPYLENGFHLPNPVPKDLLLPWVDYIAKYNLTDSAIASLQGPNPAGSPLKRLSLYQFNFVNDVVLSQSAGHIVSSANKDNAELYVKALQDIGKQNVLLGSNVLKGTRQSSGIELLVSTQEGNVVVRAKQMIVAAPPNRKNIATIGLDSHESTVLSQIGGYPFYSGVVNQTGLPAGFDFKNTALENKFDAPSLPYLVHLADSGTIPGVFYYTYSSLEPLTQAAVQAAVRKDIRKLQIALKSQGATREDTRKLQIALKSQGATQSTAPNFLAFSDDSPFHLEQSAKSIKGGFYDQMYGLQGYRNTWYVSALFVLNAAQLWNNTAALLPSIVSAASAIK